MVLGGLILFLCFFLFITCCFFRARRYWKLQFLNKVEIEEDGHVDAPKTTRDLLGSGPIEEAQTQRDQDSFRTSRRLNVHPVDQNKSTVMPEDKLNKIDIQS